MSKQKPLSPEKYITTKARSLPIYKCYITGAWEETKMTSAIVMRRHVNGNITGGIYLVDLLCLGIKDTSFIFNIPEEEFEERTNLAQGYFEEVEYNLVHNIIYAGHDFAMEYDIKPHKDFNITKFILEEDDDKIPLIEIEVGDENGEPHLMVSESYNYASALQKLKLNAGEGNYSFTIGNDLDLDDELEEDELEEDALTFDDTEEGVIDFHIVADTDTEELEALMEEQTRSLPEQFVISTELLLRQLAETEPDAIVDIERLKETKDFKLYDKKVQQWQESHESMDDQIKMIFPVLKSLATNEFNLDDQTLFGEFLKLMEKHKSEGDLSYVIAAAIPLKLLLPNLNELENSFNQFSPAVQLLITAYVATVPRESYTQYEFILNASKVDSAYPFNRFIHAMHHKLFWLVKAMHAIQKNDKEAIFHYHNLLRYSGTGGAIKFLYAIQLTNWLQNYMGIEDENEDEVEDEDSDS